MSVGKLELHGYEFLLTVPDDFVFEGDVREFDFKGGLRDQDVTSLLFYYRSRMISLWADKRGEIGAQRV